MHYERKEINHVAHNSNFIYLNHLTLFDEIYLDKIGNKSIVLKICLFGSHSKRDCFAVIKLKIGGSTLY